MPESPAVRPNKTFPRLYSSLLASLGLGLALAGCGDPRDAYAGVYQLTVFQQIGRAHV